MHQEAVQNRSVVTVVIKAVGESRITIRGLGVGAPNNALVKVSNSDLVVLVVVEEQQLIERFGHVINAARTGRMKNFLFKTAAVRLGHFHLEVALRDGGATVGSIAVHTHRSEVHHVDVLARFHDRG